MRAKSFIKKVALHNGIKQILNQSMFARNKEDSPVLGIFIVALSLLSFVMVLAIVMIVVRFFIR